MAPKQNGPNNGECAPEDFFGDSLAGPAESTFLDYESMRANGRERKGAELKVHRYTLDNGMNVVIVPRPEAPSLTALIEVRAGALHEKPNEKGVAHFLEHLLIGRNLSLGPSGRLKGDDLSGDINGQTDWRKTIYFLDVDPKDENWALTGLHQIVFNPNLDLDKLPLELGVVKQEIRQSGQPIEPRQGVLGSFGKGSIAGSIDEVSALGISELMSFYSRYYHPDNSTLYVIGDTDFLTDARIENIFGSLKPSKDAATLPLPPFSAQSFNRELRIIAAHRPDTRLEFSFLAPATTLEEAVCAKMITKALIQRMSAELRNERGTVYSVGGWGFRSNELSGVTLSTHTSHEESKSVYTLMRQEIDNLVAQGLTDHDFEYFRKRIGTEVSRSEKSSTNMGLYHKLSQENFELERSATSGEIIEALANLDRATLLDYLRKHFSTDQAQITILGSPKPFEGIEGAVFDAAIPDYAWGHVDHPIKKKPA